MRILVTGSRNWTNRQAVRQALDDIGFEQGFRGMLVVHGGCPSGADQFASEWVRHNWVLGVREEVYHANWEAHGRAAGPIRNKAMVDVGAHLCLAFPLGRSAGTRGCMRLAAAAGIPVKEHTP